MNIPVWQAVLMIVIPSIITFGIRSIPFVFFGKNKSMPQVIKYLGKMLPPSIMATLLIYCLKNVVSQSFFLSLPTFISIIVVILLHMWKKNTLLSIIAGTAVYMVLINVL